MARVELGDRVRDRITGLEGIAVARTSWLYGCERITIQPERLKDGKPLDTYTVDEPQIEVLKEGVAKRQPVPTHGPMPNTPNHSSPERR